LGECPKSPSGTHSWIANEVGGEKCLWCGELKSPSWVSTAPQALDKLEHSSGLTELPQIIYGGEGYWMNTPLDKYWLPAEVVKVFYDYWFYPAYHPPEFLSRDLWKYKVEEVGGSVHLPAEHLGPIEKQGRYSKIYVYREGNIYFVPVYFKYDSEKYVKFVYLKVGAAEPVLSAIQPSFEVRELSGVLEKQLASQLNDERMASGAYTFMANQAEKLASIDSANATVWKEIEHRLREIANDESKHYNILEMLLMKRGFPSTR
jgi:nitroimidazol reductase NimA-like FMN-containing flavoprotein (pyridoxamine 5'-phosphate oxidase superfamily)